MANVQSTTEARWLWYFGHDVCPDWHCVWLKALIDHLPIHMNWLPLLFIFFVISSLALFHHCMKHFTLILVRHYFFRFFSFIFFLLSFCCLSAARYLTVGNHRAQWTTRDTHTHARNRWKRETKKKKPQKKSKTTTTTAEKRTNDQNEAQHRGSSQVSVVKILDPFVSFSVYTFLLLLRSVFIRWFVFI